MQVKGKNTPSREQVSDLLYDVAEVGKTLALQTPEVPTPTRYLTNDSAVEKLVELLDENLIGLPVFRDELVGLLSGWEKVRHKNDRQFFLRFWKGRGFFTSDWVGRGTVQAAFICVSLLGRIRNYLGRAKTKNLQEPPS